jgi:hypothetical protein
MAKVTVEPHELERTEALPFKLDSKLRELLDGFKWANRERNTSAVIINDGKSGKGKTSLSGQQAAYCDKDYIDKTINLKKIHWNPETFLNGELDSNGQLTKIGLKQARPGDVIILDEAMIINNRSAMSDLNRAIIIAMSMIRSKKITVIFNVNSLFDLDKNLAIFRSDLLCHVYGDSLTDRGKFMAFFQGADGIDRIKELYIEGKKHYDYNKPHSNFNTHFSSYFVFDENEYEKQKNLGVAQYLSNKNKVEKTTKTSMQRNRAVVYMATKLKLKPIEISQIILCPPTTIYRILAEHKVENLMEEEYKEFPNTKE